MNSIRVKYDEKTDTITKNDDVSEESWSDVCEKFNDDVHRLKDIKDQDSFTSLYECFDDDNDAFYYLVKEDSSLLKLKRKNFRNKLGLSE